MHEMELIGVSMFLHSLAILLAGDSGEIRIALSPAATRDDSGRPPAA